ncbi:hypothetical protein ACA910_005299 [Epithemia clementina (nom. ined.)]
MASSNSSRSPDDNSISTLDEYYKAVALIDNGDSASAALAINQLEALQERVRTSAIISNNETVDDLTTCIIPLLALEHYLAKALTQLPIAGRDGMKDRLLNLRRACDLWSYFFHSLENLEMLSKLEKDEYHPLLELSEASNEETQRILSISRDTKIARYNAKKQLEQDLEKLQALMERRKRLGLGTEEMDGHDQESLERSLALKALDLTKQNAIEEWSSVVQELPMLSRMVKHQEQDSREAERYPGAQHEQQQRSAANNNPPSSSGRPLQVTHITKDPTTGTLQIKKEEIRSQVFRRGGNQPTMTIEELAEIEVAAAMERDRRQKQQEAAQEGAPRRYEQLVKAGLEDNAALMDASAPLDRAWDDFKDENPRGSGNKRGDVGDRNF